MKSKRALILAWRVHRCSPVGEVKKLIQEMMRDRHRIILVDSVIHAHSTDRTKWKLGKYSKSDILAVRGESVIHI